MPTAIVLKKPISSTNTASTSVYYQLEAVTIPSKPLEDNEVAVKILAAGLNHRDLFIRQNLYPGIAFGTSLLSDGCGIVTKAGSSSEAQRWIGKIVLVNPASGWSSDPQAPESPSGLAYLGANKLNTKGTLTDELIISSDQLEEAPAHLTAVQAASLPLAGLTVWRAVVTKSKAATIGNHILITGVGGGVAQLALFFALSRGAKVYVTSGDQAKLRAAMDLGAADGVSYREKDWDKELLRKLPRDRPHFDTIIDGAADRLLAIQPGGIIVVYGMTQEPTMPFPMSAVLRHLEIQSVTGGSRQEFHDMVEHVAKHRITPVISRVATNWTDLREIESLFEDIAKGKKFGKLVVEIAKEEGLVSKI
ncbi:hypothetical protein M409DRAFT_16610 [Zasmidium cellare ATCC 36951]|uniref:Enoyl reductase (ER) domain-containing protein n=1 Tax=Zasmidium cellare ATCC 36951 TaxID=1080233 RepID=A0A6A6D2K0_ZASCE|nr:uncharacterized protein M409DRAFT_16610 [Zasmidium cellare ATCC 36951]KAF2172648.1 hypothetical protein M409DRAFT_16610 [Zasmidium cellare ATCC 36951]